MSSPEQSMSERVLDEHGAIWLTTPPTSVANARAVVDSGLTTRPNGHLLAIQTREQPIYIHLGALDEFNDVLRTITEQKPVQHVDGVINISAEEPAVAKDPLVAVTALGERRTRIEEYDGDGDTMDCVQCQEPIAGGDLILIQRISGREATLRDDINEANVLRAGLHQTCVSSFTTVLDSAFDQSDILLSDHL